MIGTQIKYYRKKNSLTQQKLADILNVQKGTISMWELNKRTPDIPTLIKLSEAFKIDIGDLIGTKKEVEQNKPLLAQQHCINLIQKLSGLQLEKAEAYLTALNDMNKENTFNS